jgi:uncharacterized caspase-like protein
LPRLAPFLLWLVLAAGALPGMAAEKRVALVIGNANYSFVKPLANPGNDARAVGEALTRLGFTVYLDTDVGLALMNATIAAFGQDAADATIALFFYAGHGVQWNGENYLIPVDSTVQSADLLPYLASSLGFVERSIEKARVRLIFLDACRNLPGELLAKNASRSFEATRGLASPAAASSGTFYAYATAPNTVALDGTGTHSPFTGALLSHLEKPGIDLYELMRLVRTDVMAATGNRQVPWETGSLTGRVVLTAAAETPPAPAPVPPPVDVALSADRDLATRRELAFWEAVHRNGTLAAYESYLTAFPDGTFRALARLEIDRLRDRPAVAERTVAPSPAAPQAARPAAPVRELRTPAVLRVPESADTFARLFPTVQRASRPLRPPAAIPVGDRRDPAPVRPALPPPAAALPGSPDRSDVELALAADPAARRELQERLVRLGVLRGVADGIVGPVTRAAIRAWQTRRGFAPTGYLDVPQLAALIAESDRIPARPAVVPRRPAAPAAVPEPPPPPASRSGSGIRAP